MAASVSGNLLATIRNRLNVTWDDSDTNALLTTLAEEGEVYLNRIAGAELDFETPGSPRTLLMEYVRYARDGGTDVFENNYRHLLLELQTDKAVERYASETESSGA